MTTLTVKLPLAVTGRARTQDWEGLCKRPMKFGWGFPHLSLRAWLRIPTLHSGMLTLAVFLAL